MMDDDAKLAVTAPRPREVCAYVEEMAMDFAAMASQAGEAALAAALAAVGMQAGEARRRHSSEG